MIEEAKRVLANKLEERLSNVQKLTNTQLDMMNQLMLANQELNRKDIEIVTSNSQSEQLQNEFRSKKEFIERMHKPSEAMKYFEDLMRSPRENGDTIGLGYSNSTTEKKESSKSEEQRNSNGKPTNHFYGKLGPTKSVCKRKNVNQGPKQNVKGQCYKCKMQGHQAHECITKNITTHKLNGYFYNYHMYGHREDECRQNPNWTSNKKTQATKQGNTYDWDYNTRYSCHYYQEYGHIPRNFIRKHFKGNSKRWLNRIMCFSCQKVGHVSKNYPSRSPALSSSTSQQVKKLEKEGRLQFNKSR